jgi:hypothetical protein
MTKVEEKEQLAALESIRNRACVLSAKTIALGFDGFIDSVVKVIRNKDHHRPTSYFESVQELGEYMVEKGQKNFSLELEELTTKLGGNMPIMANALAHLGPQVSCIGPLGYPAIHPVFQQMPPNCSLHSFANPGVSKVMEFKRGKIMLAEMEALNRIEWKFIKETIGAGTFLDLFTKSDMITLLNWSELDNSTDIWKGLLQDIIPKSISKKRPIGFFDLSDCSKRSNASIREAMDLLKVFSEYWDVVLSLNLNEAAIVHSVLAQKSRGEENIEKMCDEIFGNLNINTVIIHYAKQSVARNSVGLHKRKSFFIKEPAISCGSGDNFNAGFCIGRLMDLDTGTSLVLGHATSSLYMQSARSPTLTEVLDFMSHNFLRSGMLSSPVTSESI